VVTAPRSEYDQLAYADLVLRRLAGESPEAAIDMVRVVEYEARIRLRRPVSLAPGSCFEIESPTVLCAPRTARVLELLVSAASGPLPAMVPFVSAASSHSVTVAAAPPSGCTVSSTVARRAMALHWLAPWGRGEIESVATRPAFGCQRRCDDLGGQPPSGALVDPTAAYLVFAGEADPVDPTDPRWGGAPVGVVRSEPLPTDSTSLLAGSPPRISVGDVEYVLVDRCPV
jgi:hypothetical protein